MVCRRVKQPSTAQGSVEIYEKKLLKHGYLLGLEAKPLGITNYYRKRPHSITGLLYIH